MAEGMGGDHREVSVTVITFPRDGHAEHHNEAVAYRFAELVAEANTPPPPASCALYFLVDVAVQEATIEVMQLAQELTELMDGAIQSESEEEARAAMAAVDARMEALSAELRERYEAASAELERLKLARGGGQQSGNPLEALMEAIARAGGGVTVIGPDGAVPLGEGGEDLDDPDLDTIMDDAGLSDEG